MSGKIALVVGGGRGLGSATALALARAGATVVIGDLLIAEADDVAAQIRALGGQATAHQADITDEQSVEALIARAVSEHGRLDVAANIAGTVGRYTPSTELDRHDFEQVMAVNVTGTFLAMKHEIGAMLETAGGAIVNTSSVNGLVGLGQLLAYTASKHAVIGMTKAAALEFGERNIRVNAVAPGPIGTEAALANSRAAGHEQALTSAIALGRYGRPEEIGETVAFLLSDAAGFITGTTVVADGGYTAA